MDFVPYVQSHADSRRGNKDMKADPDLQALGAGFCFLRVEYDV